MKKVIIAILIGSIAAGIMISGCASPSKKSESEVSVNAKNADNPHYKNAVDLLTKNANLTAQEADEAFNVFLDCGMINDEMTYVFTTTEKNVYTVWVKLAQYTVTFDENNKVSRIEDASNVIYENGQRVTEAEPTTEKAVETTAKAEKPTQAATPIIFTSYTDKVEAGSKAQVTINGVPNTEYYIHVIYNSGESTAAGLEPKTSDSDGVVSWEWEVGTNTTKGEHVITVTDGTTKETVHFTVI